MTEIVVAARRVARGSRTGSSWQESDFVCTQPNGHPRARAAIGHHGPHGLAAARREEALHARHRRDPARRRRVRRSVAARCGRVRRFQAARPARNRRTALVVGASAGNTHDSHGLIRSPTETRNLIESATPSVAEPMQTRLTASQTCVDGCAANPSPPRAPAKKLTSANISDAVVGRRVHVLLAGRLPATRTTLRTQTPPIPGFCRSAHLL